MLPETRERLSRFRAHVALDEKRRLSLVAALKPLWSGKLPQPDIKTNSEQWASEAPRSVAEAIAISDRIEASIREWNARR